MDASPQSARGRYHGEVFRVDQTFVYFYRQRPLPTTADSTQYTGLCHHRRHKVAESKLQAFRFRFGVGARRVFLGKLASESVGPMHEIVGIQPYNMIIWLASYPRSGNTYLRVILNKVFGLKTYSIYNDPSDIAADPKFSNVVGHVQLPADFDVEAARSSDEIHLIKTHELPPNNDDRAIYLVRDGRESLLSLANYRNMYNQDTSVAEAINEIIFGLDTFGYWGSHVRAWSPNHRKNTLLIKFEELIKDPNNFIQPIAELIGQNPTAENIPSFKELQSMNDKFFRKGKIDSWKAEFTIDQHLAFWMKNYSEMVEYGYTDELPSPFEDSENHAILRQLSREHDFFLKSLAKRELAKKETEITTLQAELKESFKTIEEQTQTIAFTQERVESLERDAKSNIGQIGKLNAQVGLLEHKIGMSESKRAALDQQFDNVTKLYDELVSNRAILSPVKKLHAYRALLLYLRQVKQPPIAPQKRPL